MFALKQGEAKFDLFLVCTGLGRVQRGFESYIRDLAEKLTNESVDFTFQVFLGKRLTGAVFAQQPVVHLPRGFKLYRKLGVSEFTGFNIEQLTFFFGLLPYILVKKPKTIYLGEYNLYCYLYKFRQIFGLSYSLVLYTGGQVAPGLFDSQKDFVHHITDVYYNQLIKQGVPPNRQFILPHFIDLNFPINDRLVSMIKNKANGKKIFLSVGQIDKQIKRMHLIPQILTGVSDKVFPVVVGANTSDTEDIVASLKSTFGSDGFIVTQSSRSEIGSYYAAADCFILCSAKESFGLAFVEALFFNLPVICHDFQEAHFVLEGNAHYLNLDEADKASDWVENHFLMLNKSERINGAAFVKEHYTWESLRTGYLSMFNTILLSN
jgi:glycosyltransferase involved in cell wall biosynthesis